MDDIALQTLLEEMRDDCRVVRDAFNKSEDRRQKTERQRAEDRGRRSEIRDQRTGMSMGVGEWVRGLGIQQGPGGVVPTLRSFSGFCRESRLGEPRRVFNRRPRRNAKAANRDVRAFFEVGGTTAKYAKYAKRGGQKPMTFRR